MMHVDVGAQDFVRLTESFMRFLRKQNLGHLSDQFEEQLKALENNPRHKVRFVGGGEV
jgi:hypothetical protein